MVGRIVARARNIWIIILSIVLLLGIVAAIWIFTSQSESDIPQKGVFVLLGDIDSNK